MAVKGSRAAPWEWVQRSVVLAMAAMFLTPAVAQASFTHDITIQAVSGGNVGTTVITVPDTVGSGDRWTAALGAGQPIYGAGDVLLATVRLVELQVNQDPSVELNFAVDANAADTLFTITAPTVFFGAAANPQGNAHATLTVTDNDGNGAAATGQFAGAKSYRAIYNGATDWAYLVDTVTAAAFDSGDGGGRRPTLPTIDEMIAATLTSIGAEYQFILSANDSASGTSNFTVTPEPATLALVLGGAALAMVRRRRGR